MNINHLITDWAYRVNNGMPDPKNRNHLELLEAVLRDHKYSEEFIQAYISEIEFPSAQALAKYKAKHKMRKTTKVKIAGDETTVGDAEKAAKSGEEEKPKADNKKTVEASAAANKDIADKIGSEKDPKKKESLKAEYLSNQLNNMLKVSSIESGAGRYNMNTDDVKSYRGYLDKIMNDSDEPGKSIQSLKDSQEKKYGKISESDIDNFIKDLEDSSKSDDPNFEKNIKSKVRGKGGPGSSLRLEKQGLKDTEM